MAVRAKHLRVGFIHPDLGIGGAERLVVDAAVALKSKGHYVHIFTSRHDPKRCFAETADGTVPVTVLGSWPFPKSLFGGLSIVFAMLRQIQLAWLLLFQIHAPYPLIALVNGLYALLRPLLLVPGGAAPVSLDLKPLKAYDLYIIDQLSVCVPLLRWFGQRRVIFYCHFPDKLLTGRYEIEVEETQREKDVDIRTRAGGNPIVNLVQALYRMPFDAAEEMTTGMADVKLANSAFTASVYLEAFPSLRRPPVVVYPCINLDAYTGDDEAYMSADEVALIKSDRPTLVSLNRFERKKNVGLAVRAFQACQTRESSKEPLRLVLAGGFDDKLPENAEVLRSLQDLCDELKLSHQTITAKSTRADVKDTAVTFLLNFSTAQRSYLLRSSSSRCLLYTPSNEHFGIVPVEAMASGLPVLATHTGGPRETVVDFGFHEDGTGLLRPPETDVWARAIDEILALPEERRKQVAESGRKRVRERFSLDTLAIDLDQACREVMTLGRPGLEDGLLLIIGAVGLVGAVSLVAGILYFFWPEELELSKLLPF